MFLDNRIVISKVGLMNLNPIHPTWRQTHQQINFLWSWYWRNLILGTITRHPSIGGLLILGANDREADENRFTGIKTQGFLCTHLCGGKLGVAVVETTGTWSISIDGQFQWTGVMAIFDGYLLDNYFDSIEPWRERRMLPGSTLLPK